MITDFQKPLIFAEFVVKWRKTASALLTIRLIGDILFLNGKETAKTKPVER